MLIIIFFILVTHTQKQSQVSDLQQIQKVLSTMQKQQTLNIDLLPFATLSLILRPQQEIDIFRGIYYAHTLSDDSNIYLYCIINGQKYQSLQQHFLGGFDYNTKITEGGEIKIIIINNNSQSISVQLSYELHSKQEPKMNKQRQSRKTVPQINKFYRNVLKIINNDNMIIKTLQNFNHQQAQTIIHRLKWAYYYQIIELIAVIVSSCCCLWLLKSKFQNITTV